MSKQITHAAVRVHGGQACLTATVKGDDGSKVQHHVVLDGDLNVVLDTGDKKAASAVMEGAKVAAAEAASSAPAPPEPAAETVSAAVAPVDELGTDGEDDDE